MKRVRIDESFFKDEKRFHERFAAVMGFPDFYGANWDAWIDCMSYIDQPQEQMSSVTVRTDELLEIVIERQSGDEYWKSVAWASFCVCAAAVNKRFASHGSKTRLVITEGHASAEQLIPPDQFKPRLPGR